MSDGPQVGLQTYQMTKEEQAKAHRVWPCLKCGRTEKEDCNGHGACPHGREKPNMLKEKWPQSHAACHYRTSGALTLAKTKY